MLVDIKWRRTWLIVNLNEEVQVMKDVLRFIMIRLQSKFKHLRRYYFIVIRMELHHR